MAEMSRSFSSNVYKSYYFRRNGPHPPRSSQKGTERYVGLFSRISASSKSLCHCDINYFYFPIDIEGEENAEDLVAVCKSLHRVAVQCQQNGKSLCFYHKTVVPCLLSLTVQAAMQGDQHILRSFYSTLLLIPNRFIHHSHFVFDFLL